MVSDKSDLTRSPEEGPATVRGWIIVSALALGFLLWGLLIFFTVGVSWPPPWRYGTVPDVPGQSAYSVQQAEKWIGTAPWEGGRVREQHVRGAGSGSGKPRGPGGF
ncbi:MAG: hypothetical protein HY892_04945 [Deltaproteobacteria bacterium]|nr:hypothetical protein [Deltaproteobacteria bacterium]